MPADADGTVPAVSVAALAATAPADSVAVALAAAGSPAVAADSAAAEAGVPGEETGKEQTMSAALTWIAVIGIFIGSILLMIALGWITSKLWHLAADHDFRNTHHEHDED